MYMLLYGLLHHCLIHQRTVNAVYTVLALWSVQVLSRWQVPLSWRSLRWKWQWCWCQYRSHTQVTHTQVTHTQVTHTSHTHTGHTHTVHIQPARECGWPSDHINLAFLVDSTLQLGSHLCVAWCVNICQWRKCRQESIHDCSVGHFIYSQTLLRFLPVFVHPHSTIMLCLEVEVAIMCSLYSTATTTLWCDILSNCQSTKHEGLLLMLFCTLW